MKKFATCAAIIALAAFTGCASNSELEEVKDTAEAARATADQALRTAESAAQKADDADARSRAAEEMLNRGYKRSMYK
jgi:murein lipoprotein